MFWIYFIVTVATFLTMEFIAWFTHKYIMHGFLWKLHKDHHDHSNTGFFEKNDAFFLIFAIPSFLLFLIGSLNNFNFFFWMGLGILFYGIAYFLVHDVYIHQRFKWFRSIDNKYFKVIKWAHKMHHKHINKEHGESFGMLIVAKKYWDAIK